MSGKSAKSRQKHYRALTNMHRGTSGNQLGPPPRHMTFAMKVGVFLGNKASRYGQVLTTIYLFMLAPLVLFMPLSDSTKVIHVFFLIPMAIALVFFLVAGFQVHKALELLANGEVTTATLISATKTRWSLPVTRYRWERLYTAHYQVKVGTRTYDAILRTTEPGCLQTNPYIIINPLTGSYTFLQEADSLSTGLGFPSVNEYGELQLNSEPFIFCGLLLFFVLLAWIIFGLQA